MTIRQKIAYFIARTVQKILQLLRGGGSSLPGKIALSIDSSILKKLAADYDVVFITGTNGKTLTTAFIYEACKNLRIDVISNSSGANMIQGITGTFIANPRIATVERGLAILEVDEGSLKAVSEQIEPMAIVFTNIFADQLDRFGSPEEAYQLLVEAAKAHPKAKLFINADQPLFQSVPFDNPIHYFGWSRDAMEKVDLSTEAATCPLCGETLEYHGRSYATLGDYYCPQGHFNRPELDDRLTNIHDQSHTGTHISINYDAYLVKQAGIYNVYNALTTYTVARYLGANGADIQKAFFNVQIEGRQEILEKKDTIFILNICKNPVGFNQIIDQVRQEKEDFALFVAMNDNYADGKDTSWLWETNLSTLDNNPHLKDIFLSGSVYPELEEILKDSHLETKLDYASYSYHEVFHWLKETNPKKVYVIANYTAMRDFKEEFKRY